jgi:dethiobiotin synthetase
MYEHLKTHTTLYRLIQPVSPHSFSPPAATAIIQKQIEQHIMRIDQYEVLLAMKDNR